MDWNVVVTAREPYFQQALELAREFGPVGKTHYYDVLVLKVAEPRDFLHRLHERLAAEPALGECLGHVTPCDETFTFQSPQEFEERSADIVRRYIPALAGRRFHVRMHRRGFKGRLHATDEEQALDHVLLEALDAAGTPGEITFDEPDAILSAETVDCRAGLALWTRDDLQRYPLLRLD